MTNIDRIGISTLLVRCPNWVGDVVMATPALDALRAGFPGARLICLAKRNAQNIVRDGPWFDEYIDCRDKTWGGFWQVVREVKAYKPDMAVVLPNSFRSVLPIRLAGVKRVYGYRRGGRGILIAGGPVPQRENGKFVPMPMQDYYLGICRWLGLDLPDDPKPRMFIGPELRQKGETLLHKYGIAAHDVVIGLNPGASFGASKCWPAEHFARLAELLENRWQAKLLLFAGPGEEAIAQAIVQKSSARIINTAPDKVDLALLKPLIQRCQLLVTNDTGPRHYAVAFDVPAVVLMGPTDPGWTAANLDQTRVLRIDMPCSPCHKKTCPTDHRCMTEITPAMAFAAAGELLKKLP